MIVGIGNDVILISRVEKILKNFQDRFFDKIFTHNEINDSKKTHNSLRFYAKRFAAKEAFAKATGLGIGRGINFSDIEIFNDDLGKPMVKLINDKQNFLLQHFKCKELKFHISLSDEKNVAMATVIIEKTK